MEKYNGRKFEELLNVKRSDYTGAEEIYFDTMKKKVTASTKSGELGIISKVTLFTQAVTGAAVDAVGNTITAIGKDSKDRIMIQKAKNDKKTSLQREVDLATLEVLYRNDQMSKEDYDNAVEELLQ